MVTLAELTNRQQRIWSGGDFHQIGLRLVPVSERLAGALDIRPGERVIDIAGGTGNSALAAARRDATVICSDFAPALLATARRRSDVEMLPFDILVADAQALPFPDGVFDVAISTFGVMFAPDQERAAVELTRIVRPGGRIGLANWTPSGVGGAVLELIARYTTPTPGVPPAVRWGTAEGLGDLLRPHVTGIRTERRTIDVTAPSQDVLFARHRAAFGPVTHLLAGLDEASAAEFERDWRTTWQQFNRVDGGPVVAPHEYLEIVAVR
jgi:SAM-dependent methyltransferase